MKFLVFLAAALFVAPILRAAEAEVSPELKALAAEIAAAPDDDARAALLAKTPGAWLEDHSLARELIRSAQQRTLAGDYVGSETLLRFVLRFAEDRGDEEVVASAETMLASPLREFGDLEEALTLINRALRYYERKPENARSFSSALLGAAIIHLYRSEFREALHLLERAQTLAESIDYKEGVIPILNTIGEVFRAEGQPERALHFYEKARALVGDDHAWNMAFLFNNIGQTYEAMGRIDRAIDYISRARQVAEQVKFRPRVATSLAVLGNLHLRKSELEEAERYYRESLALSRELREPPGEARALLGLAEVARRRGDGEGGLKAATQSAAIERQIGRHSELAHALTTVGRCQLALHNRDEARAAFTEAISETERVRRQVAGDAAESEAFFAGKVAPYHEMVALLVAEDHKEEALKMAERASARALLDILSSGRADAEEKTNESDRRKRRELSRRLADLNHQLKQARSATPENETEVARLQTAVTEARDARENFEATAFASHDARVAGEVATTDQIRQLVADRKTALLRFVVNESETVLFIIRAGETAGLRIETFTLPIARAELAQQISRFRSQLASRALDWEQPARRLYDALLKASEPDWQDAPRLVIVPDGPLWELPFQALQNGPRSLLDQHSVSSAPSLSFLARSGRQSAPSREMRLLALGNPSLGEGSEESLPAAETQVLEIARVFGQNRSRTLIGDAASEDAFKLDGPNFDLLHFATHGVVNDTAPLYSHLLLAQEHLAPGEDGLLEAWELMRMKLRARLAVLSACETARGRLSDGEGMIGLSWALLVAGCPSTIVSHWKVDSASSTALMIAFYQHLRDGASPREALREASLALRQETRFRHPFYWAPFVVVGSG